MLGPGPAGLSNPLMMQHTWKVVGCDGHLNIHSAVQRPASTNLSKHSPACLRVPKRLFIEQTACSRTCSSPYTWDNIAVPAILGSQ